MERMNIYANLACTGNIPPSSVGLRPPSLKPHRINVRVCARITFMHNTHAGYASILYVNQLHLDIWGLVGITYIL